MRRTRNAETCAPRGTENAPCAAHERSASPVLPLHRCRLPTLRGLLRLRETFKRVLTYASLALRGESALARLRFCDGRCLLLKRRASARGLLRRTPLLLLSAHERDDGPMRVALLLLRDLRGVVTDRLPAATVDTLGALRSGAHRSGRLVERRLDGGLRRLRLRSHVTEGAGEARRVAVDAKHCARQRSSSFVRCRSCVRQRRARSCVIIVRASLIPPRC